MSRVSERPLWTCPRCGAQLAGRNMWHACGDYSVEQFLAGKGERARQLFQGLVELISLCGPVTPAPAKTRVAYMVRTRFCAVERLSDRSLRLEFGLPCPLTSKRITRIDNLNGWYVHWITISSPDELDSELRDWLCESYHQMGEQRRFNR